MWILGNFQKDKPVEVLKKGHGFPFEEIGKGFFLFKMLILYYSGMEN